MALNGKTLAQAAGIEVNGWHELSKQASPREVVKGIVLDLSSVSLLFRRYL
jgi:hypothetical protein